MKKVEKVEVVPEVTAFLSECSSLIGNYENEMFNQDTFCEFHEYGKDALMTSPIEHFFYAAFKAIVQLNGLKMADPIEVNGEMFMEGIDIQPQVAIEKYRVDFLLHNFRIKKERTKRLVVECDSQQFHERTEPERRYEKERDRFLQSSGYHVFRFTGKEIKNEPFRVAGESLAYLTDYPLKEVLGSLINHRS